MIKTMLQFLTYISPCKWLPKVECSKFTKISQTVSKSQLLTVAVLFSWFFYNFSKYMLSISLNNPFSSTHILIVEILQISICFFSFHSVVFLHYHINAKSIHSHLECADDFQNLFFFPCSLMSPLNSNCLLDTFMLKPLRDFRLYIFKAKGMISAHARKLTYIQETGTPGLWSQTDGGLNHESATGHVHRFGQVS